MITVSTTRPGITVQAGGSLALVPLESVLYLEARLHYVIIHARCGTFRVRGTISSFERDLANAGFTHIHRGLLVNDDAVTRRTAREVELENADDCPSGSRIVRDKRIGDGSLFSEILGQV